MVSHCRKKGDARNVCDFSQEVACVAGRISRAGTFVLAAKPYNEGGGEVAKDDGGSAAKNGSLARKSRQLGWLHKMTLTYFDVILLKVTRINRG